MAEQVNGEQIQQNLDDMSQDLMATTTEAVAIEQQETDMTNLTGDGSAAPVAGEDVPPGSKINSTKDDDDDRKMFVGGLSWETTEKDLKDYFAQYGDIEDCTIKIDPVTGRSRGFGFILFSKAESVEKVLAKPVHTLDGRNIDPKIAKARGGKEPIKKIFVGGLNPDYPDEDLKAYFSKFGEIKELVRPKDKGTQKYRGFCFITFDSEKIVDTITQTQWHTLGSHQVGTEMSEVTCEVKKATPMQDNTKNQWGGGGGYGYRGGNNWGQQQGGYGYGYPYQAYGGQGYGGYGGGNYGQGYGYAGGYGSYYDYYPPNYGYGGQQYGKAPARKGHVASYHPYAPR
ncbi:PREDICTED: heterogeneous nuclear ribonucleoprotein D-like isoform X2 [Branchiostoma belcheri]|uniref:Heterogeneous nuclear ribonucleoprotein D-like isoform X2 n=1 Tax=Branchiostoma belcheri TaxID=7741 RepID=A0A6P4ZWL8_BRABE|nr:PREDICTED: heterogeneous nuclear ribonucleoprotein D-like isoform X2 [Branchiostoma belcheri]